MSKKVYSHDEAQQASLEWFGGDDLAAGVFVGKYALKNENGELLEATPDDMHKRLAKEFARIEAKYPNSLEDVDIDDYLSDWDPEVNRRVFGRIIPQGSPMAGIGNNHQHMSISNCFVVEAPYDSYAGILHTDQEQTQIMKRRGGVGFDISNIRPAGVPVHNAAGSSDGIEIFMERFSNTTREVAQNGRRGALMQTISCHHPEIEKFIKIKKNRERVTGANISIRASDEFMEAVKNDTEYAQYWPCKPGLAKEEYEIYRLVPARKIWQMMMEAAWDSAEPGILFWDTITSLSPADIYSEEGYATQSTNPCLVGSTRVVTSDGIRTIKELADSGERFQVLSWDEMEDRLTWDSADAELSSPEETVMKIRFGRGKEVILTHDHQVYTSKGWKYAEDIQKGDQVKLLVDEDGKQSTVWKGVTSTSKSDIQPVYDITCYNHHSFFANGMLVHNCGEITLSPYDSCRLLVVNLSRFVKNPFTESASFDWAAYGDAVQVAQRMMDDMIDLEIEKVDSILEKLQTDPEPIHVKRIEIDLWKKVREAAVKGRRTGTGITALGDVIAAMGMVYGSPESIEFTEEIYKNLAINAYASSIVLAKERGAFPIFNYEKEKDHPFIKKIIAELPENLQEMYRQYGRRNIALTTTAPTGSVSVLAQTSSGIEPAFKTHYKRRRKINPSDVKQGKVRVDFVDSLGDSWQEYVVYHHWFDRYMKANHEPGADPDECYKLSPYYGGTANDINWVNSVDLQAAAQRYVCHSISKTCNLPNDVSVDLVSDVYYRAWETGCKGFTIYRDGSRTGVLVSADEKEKEEFVVRNAPKRPETLPCEIHHATIKGEKWTILIGLLEDKPYEVIGGLSEMIEIPRKHNTGTIKKKSYKTKPSRYDLTIGEGDERLVIRDLVETFANPNHSAFTRTISLSLRHGVPINYLVEQLQKDKDADMFSLSRVIARTLKKYIKDGTKANSIKMEGCETPEKCDIQYVEGCATCASCGMSKCG